MPGNWLYAPTVFGLILLIAAVHMPDRAICDSEFAVNSCQPVVVAVSMTVSVFVLVVACVLVRSARTSLKALKSLARRGLGWKRQWWRVERVREAGRCQSSSLVRLQTK